MISIAVNIYLIKDNNRSPCSFSLKSLLLKYENKGHWNIQWPKSIGASRSFDLASVFLAFSVWFLVGLLNTPIICKNICVRLVNHLADVHLYLCFKLKVNVILKKHDSFLTSRYLTSFVVKRKIWNTAIQFLSDGNSLWRKPNWLRLRLKL